MQGNFANFKPYFSNVFDNEMGKFLAPHHKAGYPDDADPVPSLLDRGGKGWHEQKIRSKELKRLRKRKKKEQKNERNNKRKERKKKKEQKHVLNESVTDNG